MHLILVVLRQLDRRPSQTSLTTSPLAIFGCNHMNTCAKLNELRET